MKFLYDYFPIICFFIAYKLFGIYVATAVTMAAATIQVIGHRLIYGHFEKLHIITLVMVIVLGGSTLLFHDAIFIKWKPSIIYWLFAIALLGSQFISQQPLLQRMLGSKITLSKPVWLRLNTLWALFFLFLGVLNLYVVYHYDTTTWVYFKLFGTLGLTLVFIVGQSFYMAHHMPTEDKLLDGK